MGDWRLCGRRRGMADPIETIGTFLVAIGKFKLLGEGRMHTAGLGRIQAEELTVKDEQLQDLVFAKDLPGIRKRRRPTTEQQQALHSPWKAADMLNMNGQLARCYAKECFLVFVNVNLQHLSGLLEAELDKEF
ncbi:hypothetical protein ABBQ32_009702 [Trebouxia sp. C0010 RCD-2024]